MIYIAEHVPERLQELVRLLTCWEWRTFDDGLSLYQTLQEETPPNLLILNLLLPGMDPFLMVRLLKFDARFAQMPILCLTAYQEPGLPDRLHRLGARGWLPENGDPQLLLEAVTALLGETPETPLRLSLRSISRRGTPTLRLQAASQA